MTYLLSLATLHAAAPGALDVIFGPDGDFEGAPNWHPPLWDGAWAYHFGDVPDPLDGLALDLRIPSVAARLAGLCARAMGGAGDGWRVVRNTGPWALARYHSPGMVQAYYWTFAGWQGHNGVNLTLTDDETPESVLAKLTLALAPRIAALGRTP